MAFLNKALPVFLGFEEAFTTFPFFAAAELLEEAGLDFMATDFFFEAFFGKGLGDDLGTGFFLAMQSPFYGEVKNQTMGQRRNDSFSIVFQQYVREEGTKLNSFLRMDLPVHSQKPLEHLGNSWEAQRPFKKFHI